MEKILNFLSVNYIWFFVGAAVLIFALIGFLVQSKKRKKDSEFKGESVPESQPTNPVSEQPVQEPAMETVEINEPVMPINDVPIEEPANTEKIEFLSNISDIPQAPTEPSIDEIEPIHDMNPTQPVEPINNFNEIPKDTNNIYDEPIIPQADNNTSFKDNNIV